MKAVRPAILVPILAVVALILRVLPRFASVFTGDFVNFQETDAWFHVRVVENLVHHFPWRIAVDPYMGPPPVQHVATGPLYDWLLAAIASIAGFGHPSESLLYTLAAWYPAVLGALIVPVVYWLGDRMLSREAALVAASVIATLPGHFLVVSSIGFTDHHVMESLLSGCFILALLHALDRPDSTKRTVLAAFALAAYLLAFVGGAFFVAIIVAWACYDRLRSSWTRPEPASPAHPIVLSLLIAAVIVAPWYSLLWMPFSIAALIGGALAIFLLDRLNPRYALIACVAVAAALLLVPQVRTALGSVLPFLAPSWFGRSGAVAELQSLVLNRGAFTLVPAWKQFGGAYILSVAGLALLGELTLRRPTRSLSLLFFWSAAMFLVSMGQLRMTYYYALAVALVSGYVVMRLFSRESRTVVRWVLGLLFVGGVLVPNVVAAAELGEQRSGVSDDWREALTWLRRSTPEPFGDPAYYYARYSPADVRPPAYTVMAWWDFGYWIEGIGRRVPVSNPTQANASVAASFFLAQTEDEALAILRRAGSRYVIASAELPLLSPESGVASGDYPDFFVWDRTRDIDSYFLVAIEPLEGNNYRPKLLYRPAYYRSMAPRLVIAGARGVHSPGGAAVAYFETRSASGRDFRVLTALRHFDDYPSAAAAQNECDSKGCVLVGDNPQVPCIPLEPLPHFREVFQSSDVILEAGRQKRSAVQVYEILDTLDHP